MPGDETSRAEASVDVYWLPLGAGDGTHCVRTNGRVYEVLKALVERREPVALFHSALEVTVRGDRFTIEMAPVWSADDPGRGVVREGPVGLRRLGRWRLFRYEVRCWRDGVIPDLAFAVASPQRVTTDPVRAARLLEAVHEFPEATWGRDELGVGEMWNSNSLVSWALVRSGHDVEDLRPPTHGRAPGWAAGRAVAARVARTPA